MCGKLMHYCK